MTLSLLQMFVVFCFLFVSLCYGWGETEHGLHVKLTHKHLLKGDEGSKSSQLFEFSLTNPSSQAISFLTWGTPLENPLMSSLFQVVNTETGDKAPYIGMIADRYLPDDFEESKSFFFTLEPGQTVSHIVDISHYYDLSSPVVVNPTTTFEISLDTYLHFFTGTLQEAKEIGLFTSLNTIGSSLSFAPLVSAPVKITISTVPSPPVVDPVAPAVTRLGSISDCSSSKISKINNLIPRAQTAEAKADDYLTSFRCDSPYVQWFGKVENTRLSTIRRNFANIKRNWDSKTYNIKCVSCGSGILAYVYPGDKTHLIHLCDFFFGGVPDLRLMNTLNHELSHFSDIAGTKDLMYGDAACMNLAKTDPAKAIQNACNHGYFAVMDIKC